MKNYINILKKTKIFAGVQESEICSMLSCLSARKREYKKGEYVIRQGESLEAIAVLVEGNLHIQNDDFWGNRSIINVIGVGEMFGEAYVSHDSGSVLNDVVATCDSTVVFFDAGRIMTTCSSACPFHSKVVENLFFAISEKNRRLVQKLGFVSQRSTRQKLMSYLSQQAKENKREEFEIPFNRQQLADFLSVDRSAMSNELCKMRDEGLLEFKKSCFRLRVRT